MHIRPKYKDGVIISNPYVFLRAPYFTVDTDFQKTKSKIYLRVNPEKTFVFSREIRYVYTHPIWYSKVDNAIECSRKTLSEYLRIIRLNKV